LSEYHISKLFVIFYASKLLQNMTQFDRDRLIFPFRLKELLHPENL